MTSSPSRHNNKHLVAHNRIQTNIGGTRTQYTNSPMKFFISVLQRLLKKLNNEIHSEFFKAICNAFKSTTKVRQKVADAIQYNAAAYVNIKKFTGSYPGVKVD